MKIVKKLFHRESNQEIENRLHKLTYDKDGECFPAPTDAQVALNELARFLLGDDYYTFSIKNAQANTEILYDIETRYKNSFTRLRLKFWSWYYNWR